MTEEDREKPKTLEDLTEHIQEVRHKDFENRIASFELLYKEEHKYVPLIREHAHDMVFRNPVTEKEGAYDAAYKHLNDLVKGPHTEKVGEDNLAAVMEAYVSHFLKFILKGDALKAHEELLEQMKNDPKERRAMLGTLFSHYIRDEQGRPLNPLDEQWLKANADKAKIDIVNYLRDVLGKNTVDSYTHFYVGNLTRDLIKHEEHGLVVKHVKDKYREAKIEHPDTHYHATKDTQTLLTEYSAALQGNLRALSQLGYKTPLQQEEGSHQTHGQSSRGHSGGSGHGSGH